MDAYSCSREKTKARGNYSMNSIMIDTVYNLKNTGRGGSFGGEFVRTAGIGNNILNNILL